MQSVPSGMMTMKGKLSEPTFMEKSAEFNQVVLDFLGSLRIGST